MSHETDSFHARISWCLKKHPRLFDAVRAVSRSLGMRSPAYEKLAPIFQHQSVGIFVQIGANDGISNDPLREFIVEHDRWQGVFVEPVPYLLQQCRQNYQTTHPERFHFLNAAVSNRSGQLSLWRIKESALPGLPLLARQIASTELAHLQKHLSDLTPEQVECIAVDSLTYADILQKSGFTHADLVIIDAEGHEADILESICQHTRLPGAILFESTHFDTNSWAALEKLLKTAGYELFRLPADCFAMLKT